MKGTEMPVYVYIARWFHVGRVKRLLYAMERGGVGERSWGWSHHGWTFNLSGERAEEVLYRLHSVYPASSIIKV